MHNYLFFEVLFNRCKNPTSRKVHVSDSDLVPLDTFIVLVRSRSAKHFNLMLSLESLSNGALMMCRVSSMNVSLVLSRKLKFEGLKIRLTARITLGVILTLESAVQAFSNLHMDLISLQRNTWGAGGGTAQAIQHRIFAQIGPCGAHLAWVTMCWLSLYEDSKDV